LDSNNKLKYTENFKVGDGIYALSTKISEHKNMPGYEMIKNGENFEFVHRMVAKNNKILLEERKHKTDKAVIHHSSFDKRNNSPEHLIWLNSKEHWQMHADFNKQLWSDDTKTHAYKDKIKEAHEAY